MTSKTLSILALSLTLGAAGLAHAAGTASPAIYPAKGQSAKQQDKDKYQCYAWGRDQTGFDPAQAQAAAAPAAQPPGAMARGAMGGAAIAAIGDRDPAGGAAAGALGAAVRGKMKERQAAQQQQQAQAQQKSAYDRAFKACMEGRGYVLR
ncbi:hypothetical protein [Variovorax sp. KK3]|uniref:hypothetical protein n=1 Tax=Variovorax sp. KK3 TaxID=1855728 RepID=UPI00097C1FB9|nr:hypothetical protein [Variovorax sp. KK3]